MYGQIHVARTTLKIVVLGDHSVGKTSFIRKFIDPNTQACRTVSTASVDCVTKKIVTDEFGEITLQIWDTVGEKYGDSKGPVYADAVPVTTFRNAHAYILLYDVTNENSFFHIKDRWLPRLKIIAGPGGFVEGDTLTDDRDQVFKIIVVANKIDLDGSGEVQVSRQEGRALTEELGLPFIEVSTRTSEPKDVYRPFGIVIKSVMNELTQGCATAHTTPRTLRNQSIDVNDTPFMTSLGEACCS